MIGICVIAWFEENLPAMVSEPLLNTDILETGDGSVSFKLSQTFLDHTLCFSAQSCDLTDWNSVFARHGTVPCVSCQFTELSPVLSEKWPVLLCHFSFNKSYISFVIKIVENCPGKK